jgi:LacI family gluconate utilization system Gnt-I transcriptional repressor
MTAYLLGKGYRKVAFVSAPVGEHERAAARWRGYRAALKAHAVSYDAKLVIETSLGLRQGADALLEILRREPKVDAVFYSGDIMAVGALFECLRQGWSVPERVAIAVFDDQQIAAESIPSLTTVSVPGEEIGRRATQMLLDRLLGKAVEPKRVDMGFTVVEREST